MDRFDQQGPPRLPALVEVRKKGNGHVSGRRSRARTPFSYKVCDGVSEGLIYFMVLFSPWAFGTTQPWSIWTMNITGYTLGAVLLAKWVIRWQTGFSPPRWGEARREGMIRLEEPSEKICRWFTYLLAALTVLVLLYTMISALNPRAVFKTDQQRLEYFDYIKWLPHSYDSLVTWKAFWNYLAFALFFWALRDWLLGKTRAERWEADSEDHHKSLASSPPGQFPSSQSSGVLSHSPASPSLPRLRSAGGLSVRLRRLLWLLCINGAVLALQGTLQRLDGTDKLLWLVQPRWTQSDGLFGPFAYRANAAAYFNMIWPVCLGFWLALRQLNARLRREGARFGGGSYMVLLPCAVLIAAAPVISISRGGALISLAQIIGATGLLFLATKREKSWVRASMLSLFVVILLFAGYLGWKQLAERLEYMFVDQLSNRVEIYENSRAIARDFPVLGTGPGTFGTIYLLYKEPQQVWEAYLHDDWLETRITFGWVGLSAILLMLGLVLVKWFVPGGISGSWEFAAFGCLSLGGCLVHAKFDFPFQVYSLVLLFLVLCCVLFCLSRRET